MASVGRGRAPLVRALYYLLHQSVLWGQEYGFVRQEVETGT